MSDGLQDSQLRKRPRGASCILRAVALVAGSALVVAIPNELVLLGAIVTLNLVLGEHFPFTPYAMYTTFRAQTYYLYAEDRDRRVIPLHGRFGMSADFLKRVYDTRLRHLKATGLTGVDAAESAAQWTLGLLLTRNSSADSAPTGSIRLRRVDLVSDGAGLRITDSLLADCAGEDQSSRS